MYILLHMNLSIESETTFTFFYLTAMFRCICIKDAIAPKIAMLKEIEEGLQLCGLLSEIRKHPSVFEPAFTASSCFDMTVDDFLQRLVVHFSKEQLLKSKEEDILKYFSDFVQALYYEGILHTIFYIHFFSQIWCYPLLRGYFLSRPD